MSARLAVGDPAPVFELPDTVGEPIRFDPGAHAATVLVFTANGCPYARAWHDRIQAVATDHADRDVVMLQVLSNDPIEHPEDALGVMRDRVAAGEFASPFLHDADQSVARAYGATATPEVFVIDRDGVVRYHGAPDDDYDDPAKQACFVRDALADVLAGRDVRRPSTSPAGCSVKWRVELLWWDGCPSRSAAADLVREALAELGRHDVAVAEREVRSDDEAAEIGFPGSPTFQVGRRDLFPAAVASSLTCRIYQRADGRLSPLPDRAALAERLRDALARPWDLPGWVDHRKKGATA